MNKATKKKPELEEKYKIRPLTRGDRVTLSRMIEKVADKAAPTLLDIVSLNSPDGKKMSEAEMKAQQSKFGLEVIRLLMGVLNDDLTEWFASLYDMTPEEFDKMPFDIEVKIVEQLQAADEVTGFFSGASQQFKAILGSKMTSFVKKAK